MLKKIGNNKGFLILILMLSFGLKAQTKVYFKSDSKEVSLDETFQIELVIENPGAGASYSFPVPQGFQKISGPNQSRSMQYINGKRSEQYSISYYLKPTKTGTFNISNAHYQDQKSKKITPQPFTLDVVKGRKMNIPENKNVFAQIEFNKANLYEGEATQVKLKIYVKQNSVSNIYKSDLKESKGVWKEQSKNKEITTKRKVINGQVFTEITVDEFLVFPQKTGEISIGPWETEVSIPVNFFQERKVTLVAPARKLKVSPLPSGVNNAYVGDLKLNYQISDAPYEAGNPIDVKIQISGTGNFALMDPQFMADAPEDIDVYDPKVIKNYQYTSTGLRGKKEWQYIIMPNIDGKYILPSFAVKTFNPKTKKVNTLSFPSQEIIIGKGNSVPTEDINGTPTAVSKKEIALKKEQKAYLLSGTKSYTKGFVFSYKAVYLLIGVLLAFFAFRGLLKTKIFQKWLNKKKEWNVIEALENIKKETTPLENAPQQIDDVLSQYFSELLQISKADVIWDRVLVQLQRKEVNPGLIDQIKKDWDTVNLSKYTGWSAQQKQELTQSLIDHINQLNQSWS